MTSAQPAIRIVEGAAAARASILRRQPLDEYEASPDLQASIQRLFGEPLTPDQVVRRILADVRARGDAAVQEYSQRLDGSQRAGLRVSADELAAAWERTRPALREALSLAAERIRAFYEHQYRQSWLQWDAQGGALGQIVRPIERVGVYAPNGRAAYPSSLLMAAIPARVAGVPDLVVVTPPRDGQLNDTILAAAHVAGVSEVYAVGGAQAIAALAYGTESIPRVDKIMGPGNIFVVLAKQQVYGAVAIDALPGPTETLLIADASADPALAAADLLAQAEHDPLASAILLTPSAALAAAVQQEVAQQLPSLPRRAIIEAALAQRGGIALVADLAEALALANDYAPEHLCLLTANAWELLGQVRNAGGVFVGELSCEALGDYTVGPSHIMPTGQTARFSSPVNVWDFVKVTSVFAVSAAVAQQIGPAAFTLAEEEGLQAHAQAILRRIR